MHPDFKMQEIFPVGFANPIKKTKKKKKKKKKKQKKTKNEYISISSFVTCKSP